MDNFLIYILVAAVTIISPGPGVFLTISNVVRFGISGALPGVLGIAFGNLIVATVSAAGLGVLLATSAAAFTVIKLLGAAYLIWLGIKLWRSPPSTEQDPGLNESANKGGKKGVLARTSEGLLVAVLNPKGILFHMALMPQFIDPTQPYEMEVAILAGSFSLLVVVIHMIYALISGSVRKLLSGGGGGSLYRKLGGSAFIGFGILLGAARQQ